MFLTVEKGALPTVNDDGWGSNDLDFAASFAQVLPSWSSIFSALSKVRSQRLKRRTTPEKSRAIHVGRI